METRVDDILRSYWDKEFGRPASKRQRASHLRSTLVYVIAMMIGFAEGVQRGTESAARGLNR